MAPNLVPLCLPPCSPDSFDLVFILLDRPDEAMDQCVSEHVLALHSGIQVGSAPRTTPRRPERERWFSTYACRRRVASTRGSLCRSACRPSRVTVACGFPADVGTRSVGSLYNLHLGCRGCYSEDSGWLCRPSSSPCPLPAVQGALLDPEPSPPSINLCLAQGKAQAARQRLLEFRPTQQQLTGQADPGGTTARLKLSQRLLLCVLTRRDELRPERGACRGTLA